MTRTVVESKTKTATLGFDEPFCVIGERINPTGRKKLAAELEAGDFSTVEKDALAQVAAGANILDINAGVVYNSNPNPNETEPPLMKQMIEAASMFSSDDNIKNVLNVSTYEILENAKNQQKEAIKMLGLEYPSLLPDQDSALAAGWS